MNEGESEEDRLGCRRAGSWDYTPLCSPYFSSSDSCLAASRGRRCVSVTEEMGEYAGIQSGGVWK